MSASGLTFNVVKFRKIMAAKKKRVSASSFRPQFEKFVSASLSRAAQNCPVRDLAKIQSAQSNQYQNRIDYIPSVHSTKDPTLIVNDSGEHWLYVGGKWYHENLGTLKPDIYAAYEGLLAERERRMQTPRASFIANRAQARFLYVKQFILIARALSVRITSAASASASHSRRQPPKEPHAPNASWRGGKGVLSVSIVAPFLSKATAYWEGRGLEILKDASDAERPKLVNEVRNEMILRLTKE